MFGLIATFKKLFRLEPETGEVVLVRERLRTVSTGGMPRPVTSASGGGTHSPRVARRPSNPMPPVMMVSEGEDQSERVFYVGSNSEASAGRPGSLAAGNGAQGGNALPAARRNPNDVGRGQRFWDRQPEVSAISFAVPRQGQVRTSW